MAFSFTNPWKSGIIDDMGLFLWIATAIVVSMQFVNHWFLSKGKLSITYPLSICILCIYMVTETIIALRDPEQYPMLLVNIINLWGILMATKGILRLREEKKAKEVK